MKSSKNDRFRAFNPYIGLIIAMVIFTGASSYIQAQSNPASPANWLYPDGTPEATKQVLYRSGSQEPDSFRIKWATPYIKGDLQPLIGNVMNNGKLDLSFKWGTNEIAAVVGGTPVIIDAGGFLHTSGSSIPFARSVSVLFDTLSPILNPLTTSPVIMGIETIEFENKRDSLAFAYIAGYDSKADSVAMIKRMAINLRKYDPNIFASIKPVYGRKLAGELNIFATVNMTQPTVVDDSTITSPQYMRGLAIFNSGNVLYNFPVYDMGDDFLYRVTVGPEVNIAPPSLTLQEGTRSTILLPAYPSENLDIPIRCAIDTGLTYGSNPYLFSYDLSFSGILKDIVPQDLSSLADSSRPRIRPYYVKLSDAGSEDTLFILVAEEYKGTEGSNGKPYLHLFDVKGQPLTDKNTRRYEPFAGKKDHLWSIATGDVDGNASNTFPPYYPNNPGNEILATYSTKDFAVAENRLCVLRYKTGNLVPKVTPPNSYLGRFDTIATHKINGWVSAVNDLDGAPDGKAEVVIADGPNVRVLRMRDYSEWETKLDMPFDTVVSFSFKGQTVTSAIVADLEGDGLNDLVVTTHDSTYSIGMPIYNTIKVDHPVVQAAPPQEFCPGDTIMIRWLNRVKTYGGVEILYQPYKDGVPAGSPRLIADNLPNLRDTVVYNYETDIRTAGTEGRFIVRSMEFPLLTLDSTAIVRINNPVVSLDNISGATYRTGDVVNISGTTICADSAMIEYSYPGSGWTAFYNDSTLADGSFNEDFTIPCMPVFSCSGTDTDNTIYIRAIGRKNNFRDTSDVVSFTVLPAAIDITMDPVNEITTKHVFRWNSAGMQYACDTMDVSTSIDGGTSYVLAGRVAASEGIFEMPVRLDMPDQVLFRFCCAASCMRTDTLIEYAKPKYIDIVAPNPFNPAMEELEVIYRVKEDTYITIKILDAHNRLVAEPVSNAFRSPGIAYSDRWSGKFSNGTFAANGMYYMMLEFSGGEKEVYPIFVKK